MEQHEKMDLSQFDNLCEEIFQQRARIAKLEEELDPEKKRLDELERKMLLIMEETDRDKIHVKGHGTLYIMNRFTVQTPKSLEDKRALFHYLSDKGIFDEMVSVNSQTLNSFYKTEMEQAIAEGNVDFKIPGVGDPVHSKKLCVKKG